VSLDGPAVPHLVISTDVGPVAPIAVDAISDYVLAAEYETEDIESGAAWSVSSAAGLAFGAVPMPLPQSGLTIE
jgi:hypothetical protein